jgi:hypothetical protein
MRKPLQAATMFMALALSGNAIADPDIESSGTRPSGSGANFESDQASSPQTSKTGHDGGVVTPDAHALQDSFRPTEAVARGRLDRSVSHVGAAGDGRTISSDDDARDNIENGRPALHPATPDTATPLSTLFVTPRVVSDAAPGLTGSWLSTGQYALTFVLTGRN